MKERRPRAGAFRAYGLTIRTELALPLPAGDAGPGTRVSLRVEPARRVRGREGPAVSATASGALSIRYGGVARFRLERGEEIRLEPDPRALRAAWLELATGPALAAVLVQRGRLVLHACAVAFRGRALAFAGPSGAGKSTLAAAALAAGARLLDDDRVVIDDRTPPRVLPGSPAVRLRAASARRQAATLDAATHAVLDGKRALRLEARLARRPARLAGIFLLARGGTLAVERLPGPEAALALLAHRYGARTLARAAARPLAECAALALAVPVWRLHCPRTPGSAARAIALARSLAAEREREVAGVG